MHETALEMFSGLASSYERVLRYATLWQDRYWKRWVVESVSVRRGQQVLDIGSGTLLLEELLEKSGCEVVGVDLTESMLRIGNAKRLHGVKGLVVGDGESLPLSDGTFDLVLSCYVPKYVDLGRFAEEVSRVLRPGGKIVLYDFIRPRGVFLPFLALYIDGGLRIAGTILGLTRNDSATTFRYLPGIVRKATWFEVVTEVFEKESIDQRVRRKMTGGAVGAYVGERKPYTNRTAK